MAVRLNAAGLWIGTDHTAILGKHRHVRGAYIIIYSFLVELLVFLF